MGSGLCVQRMQMRGRVISSDTSVTAVALMRDTAVTLAFSMTLENSPIHTKQCSGVTNRKQSPLFREDARGSTNLVWT